MEYINVCLDNDINPFRKGLMAGIKDKNGAKDTAKNELNGLWDHYRKLCAPDSVATADDRNEVMKRILDLAVPLLRNTAASFLFNGRSKRPFSPQEREDRIREAIIEAINDKFVKLHENALTPPTSGKKDDFTAYLATAVRRFLIDGTRKRQLFSLAQDDTLAQACELVGDNGVDEPDGTRINVDAAELAASLKQSKLGDKVGERLFREQIAPAIAFHTMHGGGQGALIAMAAAEGISHNNAKKRLERGRGHIRDKLIAVGVTPESVKNDRPGVLGVLRGLADNVRDSDDTHSR